MKRPPVIYRPIRVEAPKREIVHLATPDLMDAVCGVRQPNWNSSQADDVTCLRCRLILRRRSQVPA